MRFLAKFVNRTVPGEYFRTIYADSIHDAMRQAEKYVRKGWMLANLAEAV